MELVEARCAGELLDPCRSGAGTGPEGGQGGHGHFFSMVLPQSAALLRSLLGQGWGAELVPVRSVP